MVKATNTALYSVDRLTFLIDGLGEIIHGVGLYHQSLVYHFLAGSVVEYCAVIVQICYCSTCM